MTGMSATDPQCQFVSLTRSSHVGGQRFCSIQWVSALIPAGVGIKWSFRVVIRSVSFVEAFLDETLTFLFSYLGSFGSSD